ncbi:hypothetical protein [Hoeflea sp. 108]|nr:hypothetical protein [Hoeflea sp. 108]
MTEIANWSALTGAVIRREEIAILRAMDEAFVAAVAKEQSEATDRSKSRS